jgi:putative endonuclease
VPPTAAQHLGQLGERLALEHLRRLDYDLLDRNFRAPAGELDLIARHGSVVIFVEVKTRRVGGLDPLLSIGPQKRRRMRLVAAAWLARSPPTPRPAELRFDAIAVVLDRADRLVALDHLEGIA